MSDAVALDPAAVRLAVSAGGGRMVNVGVAHVPDVMNLEPRFLHDAPVLVGYAVGRAWVLYDRAVVKEAFAERADAALAVLDAADAPGAVAAALGLERGGALPKKHSETLRHVEETLTLAAPRSVEGSGAVAVALALVLQHQLNAVAKAARTA